MKQKAEQISRRKHKLQFYEGTWNKKKNMLIAIVVSIEKTHQATGEEEDVQLDSERRKDAEEAVGE